MKMTHIIKHSIAICLAGLAITGSAQTLQSSYFMESMVQRHELNPAFGAQSNFIVAPVLGGIQANVHSNIGLSNFLFQRGNELVTGLSSDVSADEFINGLPSNSQVEFSFELPIVSVGFRGLGGFNTISLKERSFIAASIPSSLFEFLKKGENQSGAAHYNIDNLSLYTDNYVELALGHSRKLSALEGFSYGAKVKLMFGVLGGSLSMEHLGVDLNQDRWMITSEGTAMLSSGAQFTVDENGNVNGIEMPSYRLGGFGLGFDLGVAYTPAALPDLTVSLALNDLGFISWSNMARATAGGTFEYTGFDQIGAPDQPDASQQIDDLLNEMASVIDIRPENGASHTMSLRTTLNVAAEYAILKRKISFGVLSSTRFGHPYTYAEGMAVVNFRPLQWLNLAVNGSVSTYGGALGALINICPKYVNLFVGCDYISPSTKFGAQGIPVNELNFNFRAGFAFTFGHKK